MRWLSFFVALVIVDVAPQEIVVTEDKMDLENG